MKGLKFPDRIRTAILAQSIGHDAHGRLMWLKKSIYPPQR
jgi:hypothetical protein